MSGRAAGFAASVDVAVVALLLAVAFDRPGPTSLHDPYAGEAPLSLYSVSVGAVPVPVLLAGSAFALLIAAACAADVGSLWMVRRAPESSPRHIRPKAETRAPTKERIHP